MLSGARQGERIVVAKEPMTIGSAGDCAVVLPDDGVAQRHAVIEQTASGLVIRDLGTMSRVLVNGREVHEGRLKHGDELTIGRTRFVVQALLEAEVNAGAGGRPRRRKKLLVAAVAAAAVAVVVLSGVWRPRGSVAKKLPSVAAVEERATPETAQAGGGAAATAGTEIAELRSSLAGIQKEMSELAARPVVGTVTVIRTVEVAAPPAVTSAVAQVEAGDRDAQMQLREAQRARAAGNLTAADGLLAKIQEAAPEFLPAYEERAALFEQRGLIGEALGQWLEVIERGGKGADYEKAAEEYYRLDRMEVRRAAKAPLKVRIASVEQQKFRETPEYAEMRSVSVGMRLEAPTNAASAAQEDVPVEVEVVFFDQDAESGRVSPTRAIVPTQRLKTEGQWSATHPKVVTASYLVPRDAREQDLRKGRREQYYGYVVRIYCNGELQDEDAHPRGLLHYTAGPRRDAGGAAGRQEGGL